MNLDGSVGDNANNAPREVFAVKKVLSKAGAFAFDPGNEPTTVANARFTKAIRNFQTANDLAVDGLIRSGGPTIHMLGLKTMGQENGRPSGFDAADYKQNTGRDGNLTLTGKPIFKTLGEGGGAGSSRTQKVMYIPPILPKPAGLGDSKPPILPLPPFFSKSKKRIQQFSPQWMKLFKKLVRSIGPIFEPETQKPVIGKTPARIFRYQDGRVYIAVDQRGKISPSRQGPGGVIVEKIKNEAFLEGIRRVFHPNYPKWKDRRSFQERYAAGEESYVYGPVIDKNDVVIGYLPLVDPSTRGLNKKVRLLRAPVGDDIYLTLAQIEAMGLARWHVVKRKP